MVNSQTEHSKRLRAQTAVEWRMEKKAQGWRQINVLLPPDAIATLNALAQQHGGRAAAVIAALDALHHQSEDSGREA